MTQSAESYGIFHAIFLLYRFLWGKNKFRFIRKYKISELCLRPISCITRPIFYAVSSDYAIQKINIDSDRSSRFISKLNTQRKYISCFGNQIQFLVRLIIIAKFYVYHAKQI